MSETMMAAGAAEDRSVPLAWDEANLPPTAGSLGRRLPRWAAHAIENGAAPTDIRRFTDNVLSFLPETDRGLWVAEHVRARVFEATGGESMGVRKWRAMLGAPAVLADLESGSDFPEALGRRFDLSGPDAEAVALITVRALLDAEPLVGEPYDPENPFSLPPPDPIEADVRSRAAVRAKALRESGLYPASTANWEPTPDHVRQARVNAALAKRAWRRPAPAPQLVDPAPAGAAEPKPSPAPGPLNLSPAFALRSFSLRDPASIPRRQWLFGNHLIRGEISVTLAPGGVGKTSLGLAEAVSMVTGRQLLHDAPPHRLRVGFWTGEEPADELERRLAAIAIRFRVTPDQIGDRLWLGTGNDLPITIAEEGREGRRICTPQVERLTQAVRDLQLDVLLIDPFVSTHAVSENDNASIQRAASAWKMVAHDGQVALGLAHHTRKLAGREATAEDSRGGDALVAKARDVRALNPMGETEADRLGIPPLDRHSYFWTGPGGKSNMTARTGHKRWFKIEGVGLGNGGGLNEPEDRVAVVTAWAPTEAVTELDGDAVERLRTVFRRDGPRRQNVQSGDWIGYAVGEAFGLDAAGGDRAEVRRVISALERSNVIAHSVVKTDARKSVPGYVLAAPSRGSDD
jgi:hypothetical protein